MPLTISLKVLDTASGSVTFTSIFPAAYSGRWPHVHFEVHPDTASITEITGPSTSDVIVCLLTGEIECRNADSQSSRRG